MSEKEITIEIKNPEILILIGILLSVLILELSVTFNNPIVFGDEGFHAKMAQSIAENMEYYVWAPIHRTEFTKKGFYRPPVFHLTIAGFLSLFGSNEGIIRFLPPFITFLTGIAVFLLGKELYNKKAGFIASIIVVTIPSFVTYSVLIYTDVLVTFFLTLFFLFFIKSIKKENKVYLILTGIFGALTYMTKTTGLTVYIFVFLVFFYEIITKRKFRSILKRYSVLFLFLFLVPSAYLLRNLYYYGIPICDLPISVEFLDTSGCNIEEDYGAQYEFEEAAQQVSTEQDVFRMGIMNYLSFAYGIYQVGPYVIPSIFFVFCGIFMLLFRKNKDDMFILLMMVVFLLVFFGTTMRAEDTARFTLAVVPLIALTATRWFDEIYNFVNKINILWLPAIILLILDVYILVYNFQLGLLIIPMFSLILKIAIGAIVIFPTLYFLLTKKYNYAFAITFFSLILFLSLNNAFSKMETMAKVKQFSPAFFEASDWIKENLPEDVILSTIWSHRAVYSAQRNAVGRVPDIFLSGDVTHVKEIAKKIGVTHLFIQKFSISDQNIAEHYRLESVQFFEENPDTFKNVFENGPPLEQCLQQGCDGNIVYEIVLDE